MAWSRQRWIAMVVVLFVLQVGAIFGLHTREASRVRLPSFGRVFPKDFTTNVIPSELEELSDPLIFAGAHPRGFSGSAWLVQRPMKLEVSLTSSPPKFLA